MKRICFSICGSHGVGKTTIFNKIKAAYPNYRYIDEATRYLIPKLGFENPYDFVDKFGIVFYESIIMSQWAILPSIVGKTDGPIILDRSPIDNLAYYYMLRSRSEEKYEEVLKKLCEIYCIYIDVFLFIPTGVFELIPDSMQIRETQYELECIIKRLFNYFQVDYRVITSKSVLDRFHEIEEIMEEMQND